MLVVTGRVFGAAFGRGRSGNPVRALERGERPRVERREFPELDGAAIGRLVAATPERYRLLVAVWCRPGCGRVRRSGCVARR